MRTAAAFTLLLLGAPALAEQPAAGEHRLSQEQVDQVLADAAKKREAAEAQAEAEAKKRGLPIHGEVGFAIGTGGYRSAYGTAIVDLPDGGVAQFSMGTGRDRYRDWGWYGPYAYR